MNNNKEIIISLISFIKRLPVALFFLILAWLFVMIFDLKLWLTKYLSIGSIFVAAYILAKPIATLIAKSASKLFYADEHFDRPIPQYSIPESKRKKGLFREAFEGFRHISGNYPQEVKPYVDMIDIAITDMKDKRKAEDVFHRGIATLHDKEARDELARMFKAIRSRLDIDQHVYLEPIHVKRSDEISSG